MMATILRGEAWSGEYEVTRRDGTTLAVHVTNTPFIDLDGKLIAVIGSSIDITERRAGEQARRQLASIVDGSGDAIFGSTTDGIITSWNRAAGRALRVHRRGSIGQQRHPDRPSRSERTSRWRCAHASTPAGRTSISRLRACARTERSSTC